MASRHSTRHDGIYCKLTQRNVTIATDIVTLYHGSAAVDQREAHKSCLNKRTTCPNDCIYISGGKGWGIEPTTGEKVITTGL